MNRYTISKRLCAAVVGLCTLLGAWTGNKAYAAVTNNSREVNGKITLQIERLTLTPAQAATYISNNNSATGNIKLWVYLKFEGDWITWFDGEDGANFQAPLNFCSFSYGIATKDGFNETDAPLFRTDPPAYMLSESGLNCSVDGISLPYFGQTRYSTSTNTGSFITPKWKQLKCPIYEYGNEFGPSSDAMNGLEKITEGGKTYYRLRLFQIGFRLKRAENVYVRVIDSRTYNDGFTDNATAGGYLGATSGTTELNIVNTNASSKAMYWPGGNPNAAVQDWTTAPPSFYGVENGGIFIASGPEVTQFAPVYAGGKSAFCPGETVTFSATVDLKSAKRRDLSFGLTTPVGAVMPKLEGANAATTPAASGNFKGIKIEFDATDANSTNPDFSGGPVKLKVTMPWETYANMITSPSTQADGTKYGGTVGNFSFSIGNATTAILSIKDVTPAGTGLPKLRLHVSNSPAAATTIIGKDESPYTRTKKGGSNLFDVVSGMDIGAEVFVRGTCKDDYMFDNACFKGQVSTFELNEYNYSTGDRDKTPATKGETAGNYVMYSVKMGSASKLFIGKHTWNTGCITYTDTITIKPSAKSPAPKLVMEHYDCGAKSVSFDLHADVPNGLTATDWEWVVRAEYCPGDDYGQVPSCLEDAVTANRDPLTRPTTGTYSTYFGGGVIFNAEKGFVRNGALPNNYTATVSKTGTSSKLTIAKSSDVSTTAVNSSLSVGGWWMPAADIASNCAECQNKYHYNTGANKWVYVRYKTSDNKWSEWGAIYTRMMNPSGTMANSQAKSWSVVYPGTKFGISMAQPYVKNISGEDYNLVSEGPTFRTTPSSDTTVVAGSPIQFYFFTNKIKKSGTPGDPGISSTSVELLWQSSTDGGATWTQWGVTTIGEDLTANVYATNAGTMNGVAAPTLVYPTKRTKYRVVYNATCINNDAESASNFSIPIEVSMLVNVSKGKIVADSSGVLTENAYVTCRDAADLKLLDYEPGAALQWMYSADGSTWKNINGATSATIKYSSFYPWNMMTDAVFSGGQKTYFKVKLTVPGVTDEQYSPVFVLTKHFVLSSKLTAHSGTPKLLTSGVCEGGTAAFTVSMLGSPNKLYLSAATGAYGLEQSTDNATFSDMGATKGGVSNLDVAYSKNSMTTSDNNLYVRFKNTNNGCVAYSDPVQIKVVENPAGGGTITPDAICPDKAETLTYTGDGGNAFTWMTKENGATAYTTPSSGVSGYTLQVTLTDSKLPLSVRAYPNNKRTVGADVTQCVGTMVEKTITKATNCSVALTPTPTSFCANDLKDVKLDLNPAATYATGDVKFQWLNGSTWTDLAASDYTVNETSGKVNYATVKNSFFTGKTGAVQFRVSITGLSNPSTAVTVTVNSLPTITKGTVTNPAVCAGEELTVSTNATATGGTLAYGWYIADDQTKATAHNYNVVGSGSVVTDVTMTGTSSTPLKIKALGTISAANLATLNGRVFKIKFVATSSNNCKVGDSTDGFKVVVNPLPDTGNFVKKMEAGPLSLTVSKGTYKKIAMVACAGTAVTLKTTLDGTLTTAGTPKQGNYTYAWTLDGTALPAGCTAASTGNTESKCDLSAAYSNSFADNTKKTFALKVSAAAQTAAGAAGGCDRFVYAVYEVTYKTCLPEKVTIDGAAKAKGEYLAVCANDADNAFKPVSIAPADLKKADGNTAAITKQTLYHCTRAANGTYTNITPVANTTNATAPVLYATTSSGTPCVKGNTTYGTEGSHFYFAVVERTGTGYAPRVSDTIEYVIGALPVGSVPSGAAVKLASSNNTGNLNGLTLPYQQATDNDVTISTCVGMKVDIAVSGMGTDPTDKTLATGAPKDGTGNGYKWHKDATAAFPTSIPTSLNINGVTGTFTVCNTAVAANAGYYHAWRTYERNTPIVTAATATYKTCEETFQVGTAQLKVVAMPTNPNIAVSATPNAVCTGEGSILKQTATLGTAPSGHTWTYRWYRTLPTPTGYGDPAFGTAPASTPADKALTNLTANQTWNLRAYSVNKSADNFSCYDTSKNVSVDITVTAPPTLTAPTLSDNSRCSKGAAVTLNATRTATGGVAYLYKWFKCDGSNSAADTATGKATAVAGGTSATLSVTDAGKYFVRITAYKTSGSSCPISVLSNVATITVVSEPVFKNNLDYTAGGQSGQTVSICKEEQPVLTWALKSGVTGMTVTHNTITPGSDGNLNGAKNQFTLSKTATTLSSNAVVTKTYSWALKATSTTKSECVSDTTIVFTVQINPCTNDDVANGRDHTTRSRVNPFKICSNEAAGAWPTVEIVAQNMAGRKITQIVLYHSTKRNGGAAGEAYVQKGTVTPNVTDGKFIGFDPTTDASTKTLGSHFYYAVVTRKDDAGTTTTLITDTVEYHVGSVPLPTVVDGGHIAVKNGTALAMTTAYTAKDSLLQVCVGEAAATAYVVGLSDKGISKTFSDANVSCESGSGKWYEATSHIPVPALPGSSLTLKKTNTAYTNDYGTFAASGTSRDNDKKFFYHYRNYIYANKCTFAEIAAATAAYTCDTTYPINSVGIFIVNPKPTLPTAIAARGDKSVCENDTVNLSQAPTTTAPVVANVSATVWRYRWLRDQSCKTGVTTPVTKSIVPTDFYASNADWSTKFNKGISHTELTYPITNPAHNYVTETYNSTCSGAGNQTIDQYKLRAYGQITYTDATYGDKQCYDSTATPLTAIKVLVNQPITLAPTMSVNPTSAAICMSPDNNLTLTATLNTNAANYEVKWFKRKGPSIDTTTDTKIDVTKMKSFVITNTTSPAKSELKINGASDTVKGTYYAHITAISSPCSKAAFTTTQEVVVNKPPKPSEYLVEGTGQQITASSVTSDATSYVTCAGKEPVVLKVNTKTNNNGAAVSAFTYMWSAKPFGTSSNSSTANAGSQVSITVANTAGQLGSKTFTLKITGTTAAGCSADTTVNFTLKVIDCGPDGIAAGPPTPNTTKWPSAFSSSAPASVAICKSTADSATINGAPGKPLNLVPNPLSPDDRGAITSAIWYYAPVKETLAGGKLDVDWANAKKAKTCSTSPVTQTNCAYHPAKDAAEEGGAKLNTNGEWMIWIKIKRANSAVETYSDTISYVVRENPTISNLANIKLGWSSSVPANKLVCEGTAVTLQTSAAPVYAAPSAGGKRGETAYSAADDETKYEWTNAVNGGAYGGAATTSTYTPFGAPKTTSGTTLTTAPAAPTGTKYQDNFRLTEEYWRKYVRTAGSTSGYKLPTYDIKCMTVDASNVKVVKTMYDTLFTSIAPAGVLKDAANNQAKSYCTSGIDASTKITLKFTPDASTPAATITEWEWHDGSAWKTGSDKWAAADGTTPNQIEIDLSDSRLVKPTAGLQKVYKFRGKTKNGACTGQTGEYTLTIEGEVTPGTLALDQTSLCAGSPVKATPSGIAPNTAKVTITFYDANPGTAITPAAGATAKGNSGEQTASALMSSGWSNSDAGTTSEVTAATGAKTYYARAVVKATSGICNAQVSPVVSATFYPTPTFSLGAATPNPICLTSGATVEIAFTKSTSVDTVTVYTFNAAKADKAAVLSAADAAHTYALKAADFTNNKFTLVTSQLYDNSAQGVNSKTFVYAVASQKSLSSVSGAAACADAPLAGAVEIKTGAPVTKPEIVWNSATSSDKDAGTVEEGTIKQIFKKTGGDNADTANSKYWQAIQAVGATDANYAAKTSPSNYASPYSFMANKQEYMFVFLEMPGYNNCPTVYSDTIKVKVVKSQKCVIKGVSPICRVGKKSTIELEIDATAGAGPSAIRAGSQKWSYKLSSASNWTEINATTAPTAVLGAAAPYKLSWPNHPLTAAVGTGTTYDFKVDYIVGETGNADVTNNFTLTIYAEPTLSSLDALNLPDSICQDENKPVTLKGGVSASGTVKFMFKSQDTATATGWAEKASGNNTASYAAKALADSGYYRAIVFTKEVCDTLTSYSRLRAVNKKPVAGTLAITTMPVCFGGDLTVTLSGYTGQITDYQYRTNRAATTKTDNDWVSVTAPTAAKPITAQKADGSAPLAATNGVFPNTWKKVGAKYGYNIRAKVSNGVCAAEYVSRPVEIYDTVAVATPPTDQKPVVDNDTKLPSGNVSFTASGKWAGLKYIDGTTSLTAPPDANRKLHWEYSDDDGSTWKDLKGAGISGETTGTVTIAPAGWTTLGIDEAKLKTSRFRMVISGSCKDTAITQTAKVSPQTDLTAGPVVSQTENDDHSPSGTGGCFFYGDTVVLFHNDASGQGTVSHHWRLSPSGTPIAATTKTLASEGIRFWFGKDNAGALDSSKLYMLAPVGEDAKTFWSENKNLVVIVTDDINPTENLFNADGSLKKSPDLKHFTNYELCFEEKPVWKLPHDTICSSKADTLFVLDMSTLAPAVEINRMQVYLKAKHTSVTDFTKVATYTTYGGESNSLQNTYDVDSKEITAELLLTSNKPNGKVEIKAKTPADKIDEVFDSTLVMMVIHTDYSQKNDTISAVLRIDKGIKEITANPTDMTVCEKEKIEFKADIVRHQESLLRPIDWIWQRKGSDDSWADQTARPTDAKKTGLKDVKPNVASNIAAALPTDSGVWRLKATSKCGVAATKDFNVKVNVIPTWENNLADDWIKSCAGGGIDLTAMLNVNWHPGIVWEHALTPAGPWNEVKPIVGSDRIKVMVDSTTVSDTKAANQTSITLNISPTFMTDSGYYRIRVSKAGGICSSMPDVFSDSTHYSFDTVPLLSIEGQTNFRTGQGTEFTTKVANPPTDINANCPADVETNCPVGQVCKAQTAEWWYAKKNTDGSYDNPVKLIGFLDANGGIANRGGENVITETNTTDGGKTYKVKIENAQGDMDGAKLFMVVNNCCGTSTTDTMVLSVKSSMEFVKQKADTVCEESTAKLTVTANINVSVPANRRWEYSTDGGSTWKAVPGNIAGASEDMTNGDAVLTIPNVTYAMNGYKFRLFLNDAGWKQSDAAVDQKGLGEVMTLIVKPVTNLRIFVEASPNPAPQDPNNRLNWTKLTARLAIVTPGDTTYLTKEQIGLFGYTNFDWYQIRKDMITRKADVDSFTDDDGNPHDSIFILKYLKYGTHDSSLYFAVLRHICFDLLDPEDPNDPNDPSCSDCFGKASDTALLRMYSDLHVEWRISDWEGWVETERANGTNLPFDTIWLPENTTVDDLSNYPDLPTGMIIPLEPTDDDIDGEHEHRMSFAYYITCVSKDVTELMQLELLKGVMSQNFDDILYTREWQISYDRGATWSVVDPYGEGQCANCPVYPSGDRFAGTTDDNANGGPDEGGGLVSLNGAWLRFVAHAQIDVEKDADGNLKLDADGNTIPKRLPDDEYFRPVYEYVYNDTSRVLEIVLSEPIEGKEFRFKDDRNENEAVCAAHDYVFAVTPTDESFHYEWSMMRPGDTGFVRIDTLPDIDTLTDKDTIFHYGFVQDAALENGTKVRVKIGSFCGDTVIEAEIHVMTVKLDDVQTDICADGELELKATAKDYGEKEPTYKWFINGVEVPGQTSTTLKFSQGIIPAGAVNAEGKYEVQIVAYADASVPFINQTACDKVTIMLRPMPTGINASADPASTTVEAGTTLSATVGEGSTVAWTPADKVENPAEATTPAKGLTPGENIFYATVTTEYGCTATDSVIVMVASTFALDSMTPIAIMPPTLPFDDHRDENGNINPNDTIPQTGEYGAQRGGMVTADSMVIWACENSVGFVSVHTSGGTPVLVYEWFDVDGNPIDTVASEESDSVFHRLGQEEIHAYGYDSLVNDSTFAFFLDGKVRAFRCKVTDKDGRGSTLVMKVGVMYYVTQHVAIEAIPHMRHNRFYEDQPIFFSGHPTRFSWYSFYDYNVNRDEVTKEQLSEKSLYQTSYIQEEGEDRIVYVSVFDEHKCRSYDSVVIKVIPLPNAMILNDPDYPEADLLFPEFEVEIHDSWGRLVKAMDEGRGWDAKRGGKQVQGGTYYYRVKLPTTDGFTYIKGAVTVFTKKK